MSAAMQQSISYLRWMKRSSRGVVASHRSNSVWLDDELCGSVLGTRRDAAMGAICPSLADIHVVNLRTGETTLSLSDGGDSEVTALASHHATIASGHANGCVRLASLTSGEFNLALEGHKAAVTVVKFDADGVLLASGSADTDILVWDVVGETGLYRLRGHSDAVTDVVFLSRLGRLVSCAKDSLIRIWQLDSQFCIQTLTGHRAQLWCLALSSDERFLVSGGADDEMRVWRVKTEASDDQAEYFGSIGRHSKERVASLQFTLNDRLLVCQTNDKNVQVLRIRSGEEALKKAQRREKRRIEKLKRRGQADGKNNNNNNNDDDDDDENDDDDDDDENDDDSSDEEGQKKGNKSKKNQVQVLPSDWFDSGLLLTAGSKIRSVHAVTGKKQAIRLLVALATNAIEVHVSKDGGASFEMSLEVSNNAHRADVRAVSISQDSNLILSAAGGIIKVWTSETLNLVRNIPAGYVVSAAFLPGSRHVIAGTKQGALSIFEIATAECVWTSSAHAGAVWTVEIMAGMGVGGGVMSASADRQLKLWDIQVIPAKESGESEVVRLVETASMELADDILCARSSAKGKFVAVALLDHTAKIFYADSLRLFLTLYGHRLPVLCMDMSSDEKLAVTGSADKNIKIWGLDFGDCHKSLFAHQDSVMAVSFVPKTHYVVSVGKDKVVKLWDADRFECFSTLRGHFGEVWCLSIAPSADFFVTGSHDRSICVWEKTDEPLFLEEEKQNELNELMEQQAEEAERKAAENAEGADSAGLVGRDGVAVGMTKESQTAAEKLIDCLALVEHEDTRQKHHMESMKFRQKVEAATTGKKSAAAAEPPSLKGLEENPLLLGLSPLSYLRRNLKSISPPHLEPALMGLPFSNAVSLIQRLSELMNEGGDVELVSRCLFFLVRTHHTQLAATKEALPLLDKLRLRTKNRLQLCRDVVGFNFAALRHIARQVGALPDSNVAEETLQEAIKETKKEKKKEDRKQGRTGKVDEMAKEREKRKEKRKDYSKKFAKRVRTGLDSAAGH